MQEPNFKDIYSIRQSGNEAEHPFATYVYELRFPNGGTTGKTATVTVTANSFGNIWRIEEIFNFFTAEPTEIERMVAQYAEEGNWIQDK